VSKNIGSQKTASLSTTAMEQHYRISTLAERWGYSTTTVREWFVAEPGCLVEHHPEAMHKRGYRSMRIPQSVADRVYAEHMSR
jgi:hypothetical protein